MQIWILLKAKINLKTFAIFQVDMVDTDTSHAFNLLLPLQEFPDLTSKSWLVLLTSILNF